MSDRTENGFFHDSFYSLCCIDEKGVLPKRICLPEPLNVLTWREERSTIATPNWRGRR